MPLCLVSCRVDPQKSDVECGHAPRVAAASPRRSLLCRSAHASGSCVVREQARSVKDILALIPNWIGDAAMCTPALRALHRRFPDATLTIAGRPGPCALLN